MSSLKHSNSRNASEVLSCLRSNHDLAKDYWRLKDALSLLDESPSAEMLGYQVPVSCKSSSGKGAAKAKAAAREALLEQVRVAIASLVTSYSLDCLCCWLGSLYLIVGIQQSSINSSCYVANSML